MTVTHPIQDIDVGAAFDSVLNWYREMIEAGQRPELWIGTNEGLNVGPVYRVYNLEVSGRDYDPSRDKERWDFMFEHRQDIAALMRSGYSLPTGDALLKNPFRVAAADMYIRVE
jgi:hypothetical protein